MRDTLKDLTGQTFGKWTVIRRLPNRKRALMWECQCECGTIAEIHGTSLKAGTSTQCKNCRNTKPRSHGLTHHPLYKVWQRMKGCTTNPHHQDFKYYGGRGITVCKEWLDDFQNFYDWAMSSGYRQGLTIERVDCDGDYCPENCTWVTIQEQQLNKHPKGYLSKGGELL